MNLSWGGDGGYAMSSRWRLMPLLGVLVLALSWGLLLLSLQERIQDLRLRQLLPPDLAEAVWCWRDPHRPVAAEYSDSSMAVRSLVGGEEEAGTRVSPAWISRRVFSARPGRRARVRRLNCKVLFSYVLLMAWDVMLRSFGPT